MRPSRSRHAGRVFARIQNAPMRTDYLRTVTGWLSLEHLPISRLRGTDLFPSSFTGFKYRRNACSDQAESQNGNRWAICQNAHEQLGSAEALASFQIVVLGRDADVFLTDDVLIRLKKWLVEGEGSLVCFRGPPSSQINQRLGELMPVRWMPSRESRFRVAMSTAGKALRWLSGTEGDIELANLPSLAVVARPERPKPLAVILATAVEAGAKEPVPVICYQPVGNGRVVVIEGAGMWRWAFLPAQYEQHDESYGVLWRSLVRWLVSGAGLLPSQQFALRTDKVTFSTAEIVTANLLASAERSGGPPVVKLTGKTLEKPRLLGATPTATSTMSQSVSRSVHFTFSRLPPDSIRWRLQPV